ncbi:MAG: hypothetical protein OHK003_02790 [Anaerolineales bacterium]
MIGGVGPSRTPKLVAQFAHEWNCIFLMPEQFKEDNLRIDEALKNANRDLHSLKRSMMTSCVFGHNEAALREKIQARGRPKEELQKRGIVLGSANEVKEQLYRLEAAGLQRIML